MREVRKNAYRIVIWTFGQRFSSLIVNSGHLGAIIRHVIDATRWRMNPAVGNPVENHIVRNINVQYKS